MHLIWCGRSEVDEMLVRTQQHEREGSRASSYDLRIEDEAIRRKYFEVAVTKSQKRACLFIEADFRKFAKARSYRTEKMTAMKPLKLKEKRMPEGSNDFLNVSKLAKALADELKPALDANTPLKRVFSLEEAAIYCGIPLTSL